MEAFQFRAGVAEIPMAPLAGDDSTGANGKVASAWLTVTEAPAIEIVAIRGPPRFADTLSVTLPGPVSTALPENTIQSGRL